MVYHWLPDYGVSLHAHVSPSYYDRRITNDWSWGQMADIFGRKSTLFTAILAFGLGSALSGAATSSNVLIGARVLQGIGGAGNIALTGIVIADLVPLRERGKYTGIVGAVWALGTVIGPLVGGGLANAGLWRWIFYLNVPISLAALVLTKMYLKVREPTGSIVSKLRKLDYIGSTVFLAAIVSVQIALARGGTLYPWSSWNVLLPFLGGSAGLCIFVLWIRIAHRFGVNPLIPPALFQVRSANIGFFTTFLHGVIVFGIIYINPVFFEGILGSSSLRTAVQVMPFSFLCAPFAIVAGASIALTGTYKTVNILGFVFTGLGVGLLCFLTVTPPAWQWIVFQMVISAGAGLLFTAPLPPIQAAVEPKEVAAATALYSFMRNFGACWGLAINTSIFNSRFNALGRTLPDNIYNILKNGGAYAVSTVGYKVFGEHEKEVSHIALACLRACWIAMTVLAIVGMAACFWYEKLHLTTHLETNEYGMIDENQRLGDPETK